jgi:hypothetical protein
MLYKQAFMTLALILVMPLALSCDNAVEPLADQWEIPDRNSGSASGSELMRAWENLSLEARDDRIVEEILAGNVPSWLRSLQTLTVERFAGGDFVDVEIGVLPDYLAVGSDDDFVLMPMSPQAAQRIADATDMMLPTPMLVDEIWSQSDVRVSPRPIPPSPAMTTVPVFADHNARLMAQRDSLGVISGSWVAGHKKDVVLSGRLEGTSGKVAIYGWHRLNGQAIQPVYTGHTDRWVDYSHGIRLITRSIRIDGEQADLLDLLQDASRSRWFVSDGPLTVAAYPVDVDN